MAYWNATSGNLSGVAIILESNLCGVSVLSEEEEEEVEEVEEVDAAGVALEAMLDVEPCERSVSSFMFAGSNMSAVNIFPFMKFSWVRTVEELTVPAGA